MQRRESIKIACAHLGPIWPEIHSLLQLLSCLAVVSLLVLQLPNLRQGLSLQASVKTGPPQSPDTTADDAACTMQGFGFLTSTIAIKGGASLQASAQFQKAFIYAYT